jgi:hypothetical protein
MTNFSQKACNFGEKLYSVRLEFALVARGQRRNRWVLPAKMWFLTLIMGLTGLAAWSAQASGRATVKPFFKTVSATDEYIGQKVQPTDYSSC